jgi:SSS family solute:Na+ symporter
MLGVLARLAFGWPLAWGVVIGTLFSTVYLFRGGLRADVVTDIGQFLLMFLGFGILVAALALEHGTIGFWRQHLPAGHLTWNGGRDASSILVWYFLALSALIEPSFYQRCFAARDEATARKGILLAVPFWFVFDMLTTSAGLYARAILPGLADPVASYPAIGASALPEGARGLFLVALLATIMSTVDTYAFLAGQTAGRDLWWRMRGMQSEDRVSRYTRWGLLITAVISIALALYFQSVIGIWHDIGSVATPALLIPVATSLSPRLRMSRRAALAAMLGGGGLPLAWLIAGRVAGGAPGLGWMAGVEPIYSGLAFSAACFLGDRALRKVGGDTGRARSEKA